LKIFLGGIYGGLIGLLAGLFLDIALRSALMNPVGDKPPWVGIVVTAAFWGVILVGAVLGALRGWEKSRI
jgi:hypothetical protein